MPAESNKSLWLRCKSHAWLFLLAATLAIAAFPIANRIGRLVVLVGIAALWSFAIRQLYRRRVLTALLVATHLVVAVWLCTPGRPHDPEQLRRSYISALKRYEDTRYVWGGENGFGIDCSGMIRKAFINACLDVGWRNLNPQLIRRAADVWWHDTTARGLRDGHRHNTLPVAQAIAINEIPVSSLLPGDLAVTSDGIHILAYLGEGDWIEADPQAMKVLILRAPNDSFWFSRPVEIVRWTALAPTTPPLGLRP